MTTKKQIRERMLLKRARDLEETKASGLAALEKARKLQERKDAQRTIELQQASETRDRKDRAAKAKDAMKALAESAENAAYSITTYIGKHHDGAPEELEFVTHEELDATGTRYTTKEN